MPHPVTVPSLRHGRRLLQASKHGSTSRLWKSRPRKPVSIVMLNVTLLQLIYSMARNMTILFLLPTTVMYVHHIRRADYWLIDISEDGFVCSFYYFFSCLINI
ncbi:hypothetical protein R6Q59_012444 [Mikania micrantha]